MSERTTELIGGLEDEGISYRSLFEHMDEMFILLEPVLMNGGMVDFRYLDINPAFERLIGMGRDEIVGRRGEELCGTVDDHWLRTYERIIRTGEPITCEARWSGLDRFFEIHAWREDRNRCAVLLRDTTARRQAEEELRRSNTELQQFAFVASHDLREPLRTVSSFLSLLIKKHGDQLDPKAKEYVSYAIEGAERMRRLIDDLLEYSGVETRGKDFAPVDMNEVVRLSLSELSLSVIETEAQVTVGTLPTVLADGMQMKQLLTNLISNAIKFRGAAKPIVEISAIERDGKIAFAVKDNGIGIDTKHADKLFKMFSRLHTRDEYNGTGMGLAIAKKIVERHGGRIWFGSEVGKGSTFFFTLSRGGAKTRTPRSEHSG